MAMILMPGCVSWDRYRGEGINEKENWTAGARGSAESDRAFLWSEKARQTERNLGYR